MHRSDRVRAAAALAAACFLSASSAFGGEPLGGVMARSAVEASLRENPVFAILATHYPEIYKSSVDTIERAAATGEPMAAMQNTIRDSYGALLKVQMPKAERTYILEAIRMAQAQAQAEAVAASPADCMMVLGYAKVSRVMQSILTPDQINAEQTWAAAMLAQTATKPVKRTINPVDQRQLQIVALTAYDRLSSDEARQRIGRLGGKFAGVTDTSDQRAICEFSIQFSAALLTLPANEAVDLMLALNTAEQQ